MRLLIESESLLNDSTAAVSLVLILSVAGRRALQHRVDQWSMLFTVGEIRADRRGKSASFPCIWRAGPPDYLVELVFTALAACQISFFVAEHFGCSGVLAALTAGLVVGNYRPSGSLSESSHHALETFWEFIAFVANSLIFILIGAQEAQQHFRGIWLSVLVAIALVTLGRAVAIYPLCALFSRSRLKVDRRHQHILFWGGLRGALALALALALQDDLPQRDLIVSISFAVVAFSVFAQGLTIATLLHSLGQIQ